jgi:hypothetical protein
MTADNATIHWVRFEDVDDRVIADPMEVAKLPEIGQIIPISRTYVADGGPEIIVFTVKPLG